MTYAYIVRDPQGRVIGMSAANYRRALDDAWVAHQRPFSFATLETMFASTGSGTANGYTLTREQVV
jgi:hypothetical protein